MYFRGESPHGKWGVGLALNPSPSANFVGVRRGTIGFFFLTMGSPVVFFIEENVVESEYHCSGEGYPPNQDKIQTVAETKMTESYKTEL